MSTMPQNLGSNLAFRLLTQINPFRALYGCNPRFTPESSIDVHLKPANMDNATWELYLQQMPLLLQQIIVPVPVPVPVLVPTPTP